MVEQHSPLHRGVAVLVRFQSITGAHHLFRRVARYREALLRDFDVELSWHEIIRMAMGERSKDWASYDSLTEKRIVLRRSGHVIECRNEVYDHGRRQQFITVIDGVETRDMDHRLGVYGHLVRAIRAISEATR